MRAIYRIARLELSNLFYSPVAWLLLVLFVFMTGMTFGEMMESLSRKQELGRNLYAISKEIFYNSRGLWGSVSQWFYLVMPLLTMGLISQEFSRGSIKLLFSAPITGRHIVLGKYLGMMLYGLIMMAILLVFVVISGCIVESFGWATVLTGLLGLYLLFGLYAAIGLFMSTLTNYPIVAAIGMIALLTLLGLVSGIWQEYAFVREITYWLSLGGRANTFIRGLICSEDIIYFVIMSGMFLGFAVLKLELLRESCSFAGKVSRYLGIFLLTMLVGYLTSRPMLKWYYDATYTKENSLTKASQDIVEKLDGKLKLTTYVNLFGELYGMTAKGIKRDIDRYERYIRCKPDMELDYVFYYHADTTNENFKNRYPGKTLLGAAKDAVKLQDTRLGRYLTPEEIAEVEVEKGIRLSDERYDFVTLIERENGERTFLRVYREYMNPLPGETEISAALKRIAMRLPRVGFIEDRGTRSSVGDLNRDYSYFVSEKTYRRAMINQGFDVMDVSLKDGYGALDSLDILIVSDPLEPFSSEELDILFRYVENGKNLFVASKPKTYSCLTPLMERLGLQFEPGVLVQEAVREYPMNLLLCTVTDSVRELSHLWDNLYNMTHRKNSALSLVMPGALSIQQKSDKGFRVIPLLISRDSMAWNELETVDFVNDTARLNPKIGERAGVKTTMVGLEREQAGRLQRIIVSGDADCISMGELAVSRRGISSANGALLMAMLNWFSYEELPVNTSRPSYIDNKLNLGMEAGASLKVVLQWIFPALLLLMGIFVLIRRKGK
ncbi:MULTISPECIES: Gldg family protein [unclassified Butyricimonas]|uniref:Gldg family protein n=1 Tax=unclassified Butyricimonas TaxID=2637652 RepID=UPI000B38AA9D|nr:MULTISPECIES: Gldg family protein [unclassified Butyricimonas]OUN66991.1 hypothetical protein B5G13_01780 [Butyricimonas sp. An62]